MVFGQKPFNISCSASGGDEDFGLPDVKDERTFALLLSTLNIPENSDKESSSSEGESDIDQWSDTLSDDTTSMVAHDEDYHEVFPEDTNTVGSVVSQTLPAQDCIEMKLPLDLSNHNTINLDKNISDLNIASCNKLMHIDRCDAMVEDAMDLGGFAVEELVEETTFPDVANEVKVVPLDTSNMTRDTPIDLRNFGITY